MIVKESPLNDLLAEFESWRSQQKVVDVYNKKSKTAANLGCSGAALFGASFVMAAGGRGVSDGAFLLGAFSICLVIYAIYSAIRLGSYSKLPKARSFVPQILEELTGFLKTLGDRLGPSTVAKIRAIESWSTDNFEVSDIQRLQRREQASGGVFHGTSASDSGPESEMYEYPREETRRGVLLQGSVPLSEGATMNFQVVRVERVCIKMVYEYQTRNGKREKVFRHQASYLSVCDTFTVRVTPSPREVVRQAGPDIDLEGFKVLQALSQTVTDDGDLLLEVSLTGEPTRTCFEPLHRLMRLVLCSGS